MLVKITKIWKNSVSWTVVKDQVYFHHHQFIKEQCFSKIQQNELQEK